MHCAYRSFNLKVFLVIIEHHEQCIRFNLTLRMSFYMCSASSSSNVEDVKIMASVSLMPTTAYQTDSFQYVISSTLGIFYMLSFLYPVSRIIRSLVLEKETRIREGCRDVSI